MHKATLAALAAAAVLSVSAPAHAKPVNSHGQHKGWQWVQVCEWTAHPSIPGVMVPGDCVSTLVKAPR